MLSINVASITRVKYRTVCRTRTDRSQELMLDFEAVVNNVAKQLVVC